MKAHLKRLAIPTTWPIAKKSNKFITRPLPGASMDLSMPLNLIFRDVLEIANTSKEVKHILQNNYVFVNGIQKKNPKQNLSFMDVLEMKGTGKAYRMLLNKKGKLYLSQIEEHEAKYRPNKIVGKKILKNKKVQINFMNGYNVIVEKDDFKVGDVVVLELPEKKIMETFSLDKDVLIYLIGGKYVGRTGKVIEFDSKHITFESENETQKTDRRYSFVIGKDKPIVNVE